MAFCTNCGAQVEEGAAFCTSCGTSLNTQNNTTQAQTVNGAYGLGGAITSAILGFAGFIFGIISYIFGMGAALAGDDEVAIVAIVLTVIALALGAVALVLGIKAIGNFKKGRALGAKPIGTLIVGIGGTVFAGFTLLFAILAFMMSAAAL